MTTKQVKATELQMVTDRAGDVLADGAFVLKVSIQASNVYVRVLVPGGHFRTRRYRHDQMVKVQD